MVQVTEVRGVQFGKGVPKVIVPLVGRTKDDILQQTRRLRGTNYDMVEWRADWFEDIFDREKRMDLLYMLQRSVRDVPVLFTFRSSREGGKQIISVQEYTSLLSDTAGSGLVDMVDVEAFFPELGIESLLDRIHGHGVKVITSYHDFDRTPPEEEIIRSLLSMQELESDIIKIAVMPRDTRDVVVLLAAVEEMIREHATKPVIAMSMGHLGMISRICGETFGLAATFGSVGTGSAPGQIDAGSLTQLLEILHKG